MHVCLFFLLENEKCGNFFFSFNCILSFLFVFLFLFFVFATSWQKEKQKRGQIGPDTAKLWQNWVGMLMFARMWDKPFFLGQNDLFFFLNFKFNELNRWYYILPKINIMSTILIVDLKIDGPHSRRWDCTKVWTKVIVLY